ncbi:RNA polymerase II-associated [Copromyces sp. CBS 386.78]|nr:RNA polymerase II-associated [Copromyces sp. CBS 386.78]
MSQHPRGREERMIHQDYIARIRYSNALPPPPNPPKLLNIHSTGLSSGQYTNPGFASRLAREQPLNIEVDAELGMPLDLVGMPGVFDGNEDAISAQNPPPPVHPNDRLLLRPLNTLGKPKIGTESVSFLRRTEYIASVQVKRDNVFLNNRSANSNKDNALKRPQKRKASPEPDKGTPAWIRRRIEKSFDIAAANLADKTKIKHPTKRNVKCIDAFPLLPDTTAFPDSGAYVTVKFTTNPTNSSDKYDPRMLSGILKPIERSEAEEQAFQHAQELHNEDPENHPAPSSMMNYNLFLPLDGKESNLFRARFDVDNPDRDSEGLYPHKDGKGPHFVFPRARAYETSAETEYDHDTKYNGEVILAFRDDVGEGDSVTEQRGMYYYPIMQRSTLRNQRTRNISARTTGNGDDDSERFPDELHVTVDEPHEGLKADIKQFELNPIGYSGVSEEYQEEQQEGQGQHRDEEQDRRHERDVSETADSPRRHHTDDEDEY